eukprot:CAMPEP_0119497772 /NCGR_PEP_ID=MMETSP1344-20130328/20720_1 /TAXON_ID=236787 /ORGANISM="Florenciella parvula, Strain CCMP2471" /LENGTH=32 /DNA_ID= /DNA_START= /DNA_END= /DNA_ORIENTATION=
MAVLDGQPVAVQHGDDRASVVEELTVEQDVVN